MNATASERLRKVRRQGTRPEQLVRDAVLAAGLSPVFNETALLGTPDVVFPQRGLVVFVHGCFWHSHRGCARATIPKTHTDFWTAKFRANVRRDNRIAASLRAEGWRVWTVWECQLSPRRQSRELERLVGRIRKLPRCRRTARRRH